MKLLGWHPVRLEAEDFTDRWHQPAIRIHATITHGERAGQPLRYIDALYRSSPKAAQIARRKAHGILGRQVSEEEYATTFGAWELQYEDAWALLWQDGESIRADREPAPGQLDGRLPGGLDGAEFFGWYPPDWYCPESWAECPETFSRWRYPLDWYDEIWEEAVA